MYPIQRHQLQLLIALVVAHFVFLLAVTPVVAHTTGETYVWLNVEEDRIVGRVEINLKDLREKLDVAVPDAGEQRVEILEENREKILSYLQENYRIESDGVEIPIEYTTVGLLDLPADEGIYAQFFYTTPVGAVPDLVTITNRLFIENDFIHRSLVCVERNKKSGQVFEGEFGAMVFGSHNPVQELDLTHIDSLLRPRDFVWQGVLHIWIGTDHILFIVTLLLPAVLVYQEKTWRPVPNFATALWNIVRIVTIFTVAHSITLSMAALGLVSVPSRIVESVIAMSIILMALNSIWPKLRENAWLIIFVFGLFHGMGFASVMSELPFRMVHLVKVLIGFNVGVELGQLAIVCAVFPLIFLLRRTKFYVPVILKGGAAITAAIACFWFIERAFAL
ncbi:HupE/UreJ family protein [Stieleria varia]|uniref:HupE / UreJ protein n=1 Tax=Stieleria varia TaxID=2528005 RepID=A0A5C6B0L4_9BACT|nr:HupE/UreJ family protein [Stieleria varia]TWU04999.1 hypothetical protein Pla52n_30440 [Stieleria varia]